MVNSFQNLSTQQTIIRSEVIQQKLCFLRLSMAWIRSRDAHQVEKESSDGTLVLQMKSPRETVKDQYLWQSKNNL